MLLRLSRTLKVREELCNIKRTPFSLINKRIFINTILKLDV